MLKSIFLVQLALYLHVAQSAVAPILDIENESLGYVGTIGERNVLVDLKPHLQIKNIDAINGICSYHVFKPNSEEFPFIIDIKDKTTGEAVIEVNRKEIDLSSNEEFGPKKIHFLDCNKRKEYTFLIQAHDCTKPEADSLASNKVPVRIQVLDHDDSELKFEQEGPYKKTLVESELIYENIMSIRARDQDCTNDGYACSYKVINAPTTDSEFAFRIDQTTGQISSTRALKSGEKFDFKVRAFDCINNQSYVETDVSINVIEKCVPQWTNYPMEILSTLEATNVFDTIKATSCEQSTVSVNEDGRCQIESVDALVTLNLETKLQQANCQKKCEEVKATTTSTVQTFKNVIFSPSQTSSASQSTAKDTQADDNIEDDEDPVVVNDSDEAIVNKVVPASLPGIGDEQPTKFTSFSKTSQNAKLISDTPKFPSEFTLSVWLRRPANADRNIKEHVLCGTDSKSMNRHHFGIYFYRGNFKFLLRREHQPAVKTDSSSTETFYPSLWEWQLSEALLNDAKWHFYEVKFTYPNASLYIDGVKFIENASNSDIIDAYELNDVAEVGAITTYVGACYHARTQSLLDFFEGDIASIELSKTEKVNSQVSEEKVKPQESCKSICNEAIELSLAGADSIQSEAKKNEITIKTTNLNEMADLLRKVAYVSKETYPKPGSRSIKLSSALKCSNGKSLKMREAQIAIQVKSSKRDYVVKLEGEKSLFVSKQDVENGVEPFKDVSITKSASTGENSDEEYSSGEEPADPVSSNEPKLNKCQIRITPERNLMTPGQNNEKVMFLQNLLDDYGLKFEETVNTVVISGEQSLENYENFLRRLTYVVLGIDEVESSKLSLIKTKTFLLSCTRVEPEVDTNSVLIQMSLTQEPSGVNVAGAVAYKQAQKYIVADSEEDIVKDTISFNSRKESTATSPLLVALIVMVACSVGFVLVFAAIKIHTSKILFNSKRKTMMNEENPQMEWDDSGLNITENPLDTLEIRKECELDVDGRVREVCDEEDDEEFISSEEEDEGEMEEDELADEVDGSQHHHHHVLYSSDEEEEPKPNLEWDDMNIEISKRDKQLHSNKSAASISNKFI